MTTTKPFGEVSKKNPWERSPEESQKDYEDIAMRLSEDPVLAIPRASSSPWSMADEIERKDWDMVAQLLPPHGAERQAAMRVLKLELDAHGPGGTDVEWSSWDRSVVLPGEEVERLAVAFRCHSCWEPREGGDVVAACCQDGDRGEVACVEVPVSWLEGWTRDDSPVCSKLGRGREEEFEGFYFDV